MEFNEILNFVLVNSEKEWKDANDFERAILLDEQKKCILGDDEAIRGSKEKISKLLEENKIWCEQIPEYYSSLEDAIFNELYGLAGLAPWVYDETLEYKNSQSAKLIGNRLYCLIDGKSKLQPQVIRAERREQLKRTFLMASPKERLEEGFHEVYLFNGIRVTIYSGDRTKKDQDVMVFRKYLLKDYTFEKFAQLGTIPNEAVILFKLMVKIGFNVIFTGPVRSGKTTFMQAWQSYEDESLEGVAIATDPETPWHEIMPKAPIMQLVCDGKELEEITKSLMRGDNDYIILEEMRDAVAMNLALEITSTGTHRSKATIHSNSAYDLPRRMAEKIRIKYGGNQKEIEDRIIRNYSYVLEFAQVENDRAKKKLISLCEYSFDEKTGKREISEIISYNKERDKWIWKYHFGEDNLKIGKDFPAELDEMKNLLIKMERETVKEND